MHKCILGTLNGKHVRLFPINVDCQDARNSLTGYTCIVLSQDLRRLPPDHVVELITLGQSSNSIE